MLLVWGTVVFLSPLWLGKWPIFKCWNHFALTVLELLGLCWKENLKNAIYGQKCVRWTFNFKIIGIYWELIPNSFHVSGNAFHYMLNYRAWLYVQIHPKGVSVKFFHIRVSKPFVYGLSGWTCEQEHCHLKKDPFHKALSTLFSGTGVWNVSPREPLSCRV